MMTEDKLDNKIPVHIVTGFLGAGKTTFINEFIKSQPNVRVIVIENEIGKVNIDGALLIDKAEDIMELTGGCLCCNLNEKLYDLLYDLEKRRSEFDILVIETTGIADPSAVAETFWTGSFMEKTYEVKHTICLADAQNILQSLTSADEAHRQIAFADVILLNKCDLIDTHQLDAVRHVLLDIHPGIRIFEGVEGIFPFELISQVKIHDIDRAETDYNTLSVKHESKHHGINTFTLMFDTPFDFGRLRHTLMLLLHVNKHQIYRIKGIIDVSDMDNRIILQSVYQSYRIQEGSEWKDDEVRNSKIVFIGHDVEKSSIERVLKTCLNKQTSSK